MIVRLGSRQHPWHPDGYRWSWQSPDDHWFGSEVRRIYRKLRRAGLDKFDARLIVTDLLRVGTFADHVREQRPVEVAS